MRKERSNWWQLARMPDARTALWIVGSIGVIGSLVLLALPEDYVADETILAWLKVLILPFVIATLGIIGGAWFSRERARDTALQTYLDKMTELMTDKQLYEKKNPFDPTRVTARAQTLTTLLQLDGYRKTSVVRFLYEAQLINKKKKTLSGIDFEPRIVGLDGADLTNANLRYLTLEEAALNGAILEDADLRNAKLSRIDLGGAFLSGTDLSGTDLSSANLREAELQRKDELNLRGADLSGADLSGADFSGADLTGAKIAKEQLAACKSLVGAVPDGLIRD
jgi:hypothetical protein